MRPLVTKSENKVFKLIIQIKNYLSKIENFMVTATELRCGKINP